MGLSLQVMIQGTDQPMCCIGCQAVAQTIVDNGLDDFYTYRDSPSPKAKEALPDVLQKLQAYDDASVQGHFVQQRGENLQEASLVLEGIVCPACVWVNERNLSRLDGVSEVKVNYTTRRAQVQWDASRIQLSEILHSIYKLGYVAHPYDPGVRQQIVEKERRLLLRRLGLAAVMGVQVMMISIALYFGDWYGMEDSFRSFLYGINCFLTLPVMLYSAQAFFIPAWRDIRHLKVGMDVPVSIALLLAFLGSLWTLWSGRGEVYFDSVVMFVFFLLLGRFLELGARKKAGEVSENLVQMLPAWATRLQQQGDSTDYETVPVSRLQVGDRVLVKPGETIPVDGCVDRGESSVDESLLSGESLPLLRKPGMPVIGGSINIESPLEIIVQRVGEATVLSQILRLLERAQSGKPTITAVTDRIASWFVAGVLLLATLTAWYWFQQGNEHWFAITLSVLVVTCPCALSLAAPAAVTVATGALMQVGILPARAHAIETLARASHFVFDKTGTLTKGRLALKQTVVFSAMDERSCLDIAAGLEKQSEHPIARAILQAAQGGQTINPVDQKNFPGRGVTGQLVGVHWSLGTAEFIQQQTGLTPPDSDEQWSTQVFLADDSSLHCLFVLQDEVREDAASLLNRLQVMGRRVMILSGDHPRAVQRLAEELQVQDARAGQRPEDKLAVIDQLQAEGAVVAMIGDGINDAPVLAAAQVSIAMGSGTQAARVNSDMLLLSDKLINLQSGVQICVDAMRTIRQNIAWAIGYNLLALPLAAMGYIAPWMAAIGMSLSSVLVVVNALRLKRSKQPDDVKHS